MEQIYGNIKLINNNFFIQNYKNIEPNFKLPRIYEPLRIRLNASKEYIAYEQIYSYNDNFDVQNLKQKLVILPDYFLEVCYEFGIEIVIINDKQVLDSVIKFRKKIIRIELEKFFEMYSVGCYEPGARLVTIHHKYITNNEYNPLAFLLAKGFQHSILSNKNLLKIPEYHISYENRFLPYYVLRYAIKKNNLYFPYCFENFISEDRWIELKDKDRPLFRFFEMLFGKHKSTIEEEERTGIIYNHKDFI